MDSATNPDPTDLSALTVALGSAGLGGPEQLSFARICELVRQHG